MSRRTRGLGTNLGRHLGSGGGRALKGDVQDVSDVVDLAFSIFERASRYRGGEYQAEGPW